VHFSYIQKSRFRLIRTRLPGTGQIPMTDIFTILHLSDLHFSAKTDFKQNPVMQAFLKDIQAGVTINRSPNLVVFSGDIVHNPDEKDVYLNLIEFIDAIMKATGLTERQIVFCPGNHDVSFASIQQRALEYQSIQQLRDDCAKFDHEYTANTIREYAHQVNSGFFDFCDLLNSKWHNPYTDVRRFEEAKVSIVLFNTTTTCCLEGSRSDRGHLALSISALEKAFASIPAGDLIMSAGHHPLTDLGEVCCRDASRIIEKHSQLSAIPSFFIRTRRSEPRLCFE
jgi:3',5'-cyclic AMP phosphodiesterase CpdA